MITSITVVLNSLFLLACSIAWLLIATLNRRRFKTLEYECSQLWARHEALVQYAEALSRTVKDTHQMLHAGVAVDVGLRDRGWLILCCRVDGRDRVMIQNLKPDMTLSEYRDLVKKLSYDFQHVAYIDAPYGYESFLKSASE